MRSESGPDISLVIPVYNEVGVLDELLHSLTEVLSNIDCTYEIICIDDGSTDGSLQKLLSMQTHIPPLRVFELSRNFGKESALSAGLDQVRGSAAIPFDADIQDPPDLIPKMVAEWRNGYDVVLARRRSRTYDGWLKRLTAWAFYRTHNILADIDVPADVGDFRLMDRHVVEAVRALPERKRFMKGLFAWVGFRTTIIDFERRGRRAGTTNWSFRQLWNLALEAITSFSMVPLRLWLYVGAIISIISFCYGSAIVIRTLFFGIDFPGYASMFSTITFLGGLQLLCLGLLGEYVGRTYFETKQRPVYIIRKAYEQDEHQNKIDQDQEKQD